jgi:hypothetical protein
MFGHKPTPEHINETMDQIAERQALTPEDEIRKAFGIRKVRDTLHYIQNDTFVADPSAILGRVYYEKEGSEELQHFSSSIVAPVSATSKLTAPQTVSELIVDNKAKAGVEALALLSADVGAEELLEVRVINNATARLVDSGDDWDAAIEKWSKKTTSQRLMNNPAVKTISVVTGVVQKYLTVKKYKKFDAKAKGGSFGVNVNGSLYTSTSQFELVVVYGIEIVPFENGKGAEAVTRAMSEGAGIRNKAALESVNQKFSTMVKRGESIFPEPKHRTRDKAQPKSSKRTKKPGKPR